MKQLITGLLVLTPLVFTTLVPFAPTAVEFSNARKASYSAVVKNELTAEKTALQIELSYAPWLGETWQRLGRIQLDQNKYAEAVDAFEKASTLGQLSTEGKLWMADALISNDEPEKARELLREFSTLNEVDPFLFLQTALLQRSLNDTYGALATLLKGYEVEPQNSEINYQTGLQLSAFDPEKALPFLERAADLNPAKRAICETLATMIEESAGMGESAERYLYIGQVLSSYSEWDVAQRAFQKATELDAENAVAWALLAEAVQQNDQDGSQFITKAQQLAPNAEMVNGLSALYYRRQGKSELALIYLQKALEANPNASVWEIEIGNTLAKLGDLASAMEHYQAAVKIDPQDWAPWRALAAFCVTRNYDLVAVGLPAARKALELNEGSPALMDLLGTALLMNNQLEEAGQYFLQADAIDPHQTAILIHLGQLYIAKGEKEIALDYLKQAVEYAKDERLQETAKRLLLENGGNE